MTVAHLVDPELVEMMKMLPDTDLNDCAIKALDSRCRRNDKQGGRQQ